MDNTFLSQYRELEGRILVTLNDIVKNSKVKSIHVDEKAIHLKSTSYAELTIINHELTFLDDDGLHYSIYTVSIEDLIEIISKY